MKIFDVTKEVFGAEVYPGDPEPYWNAVMSLEGEEPDNCQLSELFLGSHTGTHMDAPRHFLKDGKDISRVDLSRCVGECQVVKAAGKISAEQMEEMLKGNPLRLLIKGKAVITEEAAEVMVRKKVVCIGVEDITVGPISAPDKVHKILLENEIVILESLDLKKIREGRYKLIALPLKMEGLDGSPVRAILIED